MPVYKPQRPFETLSKCLNKTSNQKIVHAMILQAMIDATNTNFYNEDRIRALKWFRSEAFARYCQIIEIDKDNMLEQIFSVIDWFYKKNIL